MFGESFCNSVQHPDAAANTPAARIRQVYCQCCSEWFWVRKSHAKGYKARRKYAAADGSFRIMAPVFFFAAAARSSTANIVPMRRTVYFDFLTYPLVTLVYPLGIYLYFHGGTPGKGIRGMVGNSAEWGVGYGGMWAAKWILADCLTGSASIRDAMETVFVA